jgi:periplasmic protein TonB
MLRRCTKSCLVRVAMLVSLALIGTTNRSFADQASPPPAASDTAEQAVPQRVRVSSGVAQGLLIKKVNPKYPEDAREQRIQGVVLLRARINKDGDIADLQLISGHPLLAPAAIKAVKKWKYRPYMLKGEPVEVETQIQVNFTLSGG